MSAVAEIEQLKAENIELKQIVNLARAVADCDGRKAGFPSIGLQERIKRLRTAIKGMEKDNAK